MHLLPVDRAHLRIIDPEAVCHAIEAIGDPSATARWAQHFALLGDPTRLKVLLAIRTAGPISVSDLAAATGIADTTVSQTLRHLRAAEVVSTERDGRVIRYQLIDPTLQTLLAQVTTT